VFFNIFFSGKATEPKEAKENVEKTFLTPDGNFKRPIFKRQSRLDIFADVPELRTYCTPLPGVNSIKLIGTLRGKSFKI